MTEGGECAQRHPVCVCVCMHASSCVRLQRATYRCIRISLAKGKCVSLEYVEFASEFPAAQACASVLDVYITLDSSSGYAQCCL